MELIEKAVFDQNRRVKSGSKIIVVTGIGGCGKTQLVRRFIESNRDQ
jgi:GTPase SAR1 family protein